MSTNTHADVPPTGGGTTTAEREIVKDIKEKEDYQALDLEVDPAASDATPEARQ